ncbi:MAG: hypothetical protein ABEJ28_05450 [Salinigranum sp.]
MTDEPPSERPNDRTPGEGTTDPTSDERTPRERMAAALREIRREGYKVAAIYAVVDAALVTLLANLALAVYPPPGIPRTLPVPARVVGLLPWAGHTSGPTTVETAAVAGLVAGAVAFAGEFGLRTRRPLIEQFEAANPSVREALRTARDATARGRETRMAVALYEDVLDRLRATSSVGLLDVRRVAVVILALGVVSALTVQVAVVDLDLAGFGRTPGADRAHERAANRTYDGLHSGDSILGDAENVSAGDDALRADLPSQGAGTGNGSQSAADAYDSAGYAGSRGVQSQQAGYADPEQLDDARLIREYNLKIHDTNATASP